MPDGYLCMVLHAHLPFVRHPEYEDFLEEDWLYEAITETYLPLLEMMEGLEQDNIDWRLTISVSPTLAAMLADPLLQHRYIRHLDNLISLAHKELERTRWQPEFFALAEMYNVRLQRCKDLFIKKYGNNLLNGFRHFFETGKLELITCAATHGFMPLMPNENARRAQIELGAREFARHIGRRPNGIWLPECGYIQGVDALLAESGFKFFFVETHGVMHAEPRPQRGVYAPIACPDSGVHAFARDAESSKQVWSSIEGYPGDAVYREFYRDVGFDLDFNYLKPHLHEIGIRTNLGLKYYSITGQVELSQKKPYDRTAALHKAADHAGNFMFNREKQVEWLAESMGDRPPIIVAPYDAELFGHWWYEGPEWINFLLRKIHHDQQLVKTITPSEYLAKYPKNQRCQPPMSTWGANGYCEVWLDETNDWIYPHLHEIANRMEDLAKAHSDPHPLLRRALNQAARELLLAQSSDWAFIIKTGTMMEYAIKRTNTHVDNFLRLQDQINHDRVDEPWLSEMEARHNIFPEIDYRLYS
ncbi:MAG: glycoside hydrolase family 57 protein [Gemmataceae bacterium]